ncbi:hypothetical protein [Oscillibacter sp. CAG:155]|uniref:hypothetical protein n=1 Tax=Oscillibacter sp. CAG:155 TaxID=1262910 RepID=UPI00263F835F|nr:hypothetical protein [Oscillibacter sp. CAG:155]
MAGIIFVSDLGINGRKLTAIGAVTCAVLNREGGILHVDSRAVDIAAVCAINFKNAVARNIDGGCTCLVELNGLTRFTLCVVAIDDKG